MATVTVRNLPDETHRALKRRAAKHGRSTEAEIRMILNQTAAEVELSPSEGLGTALAELGKRFGGIELDVERDRSPPRFIDFE